MSRPLPDLPRAGGLVRVLRAAQGRAYPRFVGTIRETTWTFYEVLLPALGTIAFVYVYRALGAPERFVGYVIMGGATAAIWLNVMWLMAAQLWWEKKDGNLELYLAAPCGLVPILLGMSVGGIFMASFRAAVVVLLGRLLFDVTYTVTQMGTFLGVFALAIVGLYGLGVALSSLFLMWGREAWHMTNLFMEPVFLASGFYFPVRTLGYGVGLAASLIPLTLALDAMRQLLYPGVHPRLLSLEVEIAALAALAVGFLLLARVCLRTLERLARREGRLSLRM